MKKIEVREYDIRKRHRTFIILDSRHMPTI